MPMRIPPARRCARPRLRVGRQPAVEDLRSAGRRDPARAHVVLSATGTTRGRPGSSPWPRPGRWRRRPAERRRGDQVEGVHVGIPAPSWPGTPRPLGAGVGAGAYAGRDLDAVVTAPRARMRGTLKRPSSTGVPGSAPRRDRGWERACRREDVGDRQAVCGRGHVAQVDGGDVGGVLEHRASCSV